MNKTFTITLVIIGAIVLSALIFGAGLMVGRSSWGYAGYGPAGMTLVPAPRAGVSWGSNTNPGYSMMGGNGMMGGSGMMGGNQIGVKSNAKPISVDQAKQAVEGYLKGLNNPDLQLTEVMIFDNNAYARITEKSTGIGAMELLVDPATLSVFPEYGPNMMWNLKYGPMSSNGMMGGSGMMGGNGMMGGVKTNPGSGSATMTVTSQQAAKNAQEYLDQQFPGYQVAVEADPFYGYYTIDILKDGEPTGMLSVNGFSGQVFLHTWHGAFIEMSEE